MCIRDSNTGEVFIGRVPAYSDVVPGYLPGKDLPEASKGPIQRKLRMIIQKLKMKKEKAQPTRIKTGGSTFKNTIKDATKYCNTC